VPLESLNAGSTAGPILTDFLGFWLVSLTCLERLEGPDELREASTMVSGRGRFLEEDGEGRMAGFVMFFFRLFFAEDERTDADFAFEKMWSISDMVVVWR